MTIPEDQVVKIQNRMSDIREIVKDDFVGDELLLAVGELLGTLDTVLFDERNYGYESKTSK